MPGDQLIARATYLRLRLQYQLVALATYLRFASGCADTRDRLSLRELAGGLLGRHSVHTGFLQAAPDIGWHGDRAV